MQCKGIVTKKSVEQIEIKDTDIIYEILSRYTKVNNLPFDLETSFINSKGDTIVTMDCYNGPSIHGELDVKAYAAFSFKRQLIELFK